MIFPRLSAERTAQIRERLTATAGQEWSLHSGGKPGTALLRIIDPGDPAAAAAARELIGKGQADVCDLLREAGELGREHLVLNREAIATRVAAVQTISRPTIDPATGELAIDAWVRNDPHNAKLVSFLSHLRVDLAVLLSTVEA